jgi:restriction system protein
VKWRVLSGIEFEQFLERVFLELGFITATTKASGDQGADLILTSGSVKIAVQAKGYTGSVGNDAVKDALLGKHFYGCTHCLVVTNSKFTRGAEEAALKVECMLIDGDQLPDMIRGQISLPGMQSMPLQSG